MADTDRPSVEVIVVDGHTIMRVNDVITSAIDPAPYMEVREGDIWFQEDHAEDKKAKE